MRIEPNWPEDIAVLDECLSASRDPNLYVVYYSTQGRTVSLVLDKTDILSFNWADSVCGDSNMTFGNIGSKSFSCKFYYSGAKPSLVSDSNRYYRFDIFYTPKDSVVKSRIASAGSAEAYFSTRLGVSNSYDYLINLGTYFLDNYRFRNRVGEIELVDCLGFLRSQVYMYDGGYTADHENPVIRYVVDEIATSCGISWIALNTPEKMLFGNTFKLYNAHDWDGSTCYDVLQQIAKACCGFVKAVPGNSFSDLAFSILYGGNQLYEAGIPGYPDYDCRIYYDNVYSTKYAQSNANYLGARYLGNNYAYDAQPDPLYVEVAQNDLWDGYIAQYQTQQQQEAQTRTLLQSAWQTCALPGLRPNRSTVTACPFYETLDVPSIAIDPNGYAGTLITSISMRNLGQMEVVYAGQIDTQQNYITGGGQSSTGIRKNTSAINRLSSSVSGLTRLIDTGTNSIGIGTTAPTSAVPSNGRMDIRMDVHFTGNVFATNGKIIDYLMTNPNRTTTALSSPGWYRAFKYSANSTQVRGARGLCFDIVISGEVSSGGSDNTVHCIKLIAPYDSYAFVDETSKSRANSVSKIRYTTDSSGNGYIDIYYDANVAQMVTVDVLFRGYSAGSLLRQGFTSLGSTLPTGETVRAEYTFQANTSLDKYYNSGDTGYSYGYSVGAIETQDTIGFSIKTSKEFRHGGGNVTFTRLKLSVMGVNGRIDANGWNTEYVGRSGYSYTGTIASSLPGLLYVQLKKTSGNFTYVGGGAITNYTPVSVWGDIAFTVSQ